jgi:microcin C transport system ATP-binding protein
MSTPLLSVRSLGTEFVMPGKRISRAVEDVSFDVHPGETLALVGESGSGKSVTAYSISRLLPRNARHPSGEIFFEGRDVLKLPPRSVRDILGDRISMVFQEPATSLNPVLTAGRQVAEVLVRHRGFSTRKALSQVIDLFAETGIPEPERRIHSYPHELSGGMKQRVMIAMAMACKPKLLIADEPTTALDVTIQAQILGLMRSLQEKTGMAILLITHNLGIVHEQASRMVVMQKGRVVEQGETKSLLRRPTHEYTRRLLDSLPERMARDGVENGASPVQVSPDQPSLLTAKDLKVWYPVKTGLFRRTTAYVKAVDGVSFGVQPAEIVALVGESGCGKTTIGKALVRLVQTTQGSVMIRDKDWLELSRKKLRENRRLVQMVFQDPAGSMDPRMTVREVVAEGLEGMRLIENEAELDRRVCQALEEVELDPSTRHRFPHEFSGGQRQRICIARALVVEPDFLILDEATSALDVSVQAGVLRLLKRLRVSHRLGMLFITHDLSVVRFLADRVLVMYAGRLVEEGPTAMLFAQPRQEYTRRLLESAPKVPVEDHSHEDAKA